MPYTFLESIRWGQYGRDFHMEIWVSLKFDSCVDLWLTLCNFCHILGNTPSRLFLSFEVYERHLGCQNVSIIHTFIVLLFSRWVSRHVRNVHSTRHIPGKCSVGLRRPIIRSSPCQPDPMLSTRPQPRSMGSSCRPNPMSFIVVQKMRDPSSHQGVRNHFAGEMVQGPSHSSTKCFIKWGVYKVNRHRTKELSFHIQEINLAYSFRLWHFIW